MRCTVCCEAEIEYIETYETETYGDTHIELCVGYCPNCNASFQWRETYKFVEMDDLRLIKED